MKFRKKPVVIEAVQWFKYGDHPAVVNMGVPLIMTLEGPLYVTPGDWIIKGVAGEFYPCKPDIFAATYEPVSDDAPAAPQAEPKREPLTDEQIEAQIEARDALLDFISENGTASEGVQHYLDRYVRAALAAKDEK